MDEYASLRKIEFELCGGNLPEKYKAFVRRVLNDRNLIPAADVAQVVHGRWEKTGKQNDTWTCSACGSRVGAFLAGCSAYCYHCGAKMGGGAT